MGKSEMDNSHSEVIALAERLKNIGRSWAERGGKDSGIVEHFSEMPRLEDGDAANPTPGELIELSKAAQSLCDQCAKMSQDIARLRNILSESLEWNWISFQEEKEELINSGMTEAMARAEMAHAWSIYDSIQDEISLAAKTPSDEQSPQLE